MTDHPRVCSQLTSHLYRVPHSHVLEWCRVTGAGNRAWSRTSAWSVVRPARHLTPASSTRWGWWLVARPSVWTMEQCWDHGAVWRRDQTRGHWAQRRSTGRSPAQVDSAATAASRGGVAILASPGWYILICHHFLWWSQPHHYLLISPNHPTCYITGRVNTPSTLQQVPASFTGPSLSRYQWTMDETMLELAASVPITYNWSSLEHWWSDH